MIQAALGGAGLDTDVQQMCRQGRVFVGVAFGRSSSGWLLLRMAGILACAAAPGRTAVHAHLPNALAGPAPLLRLQVALLAACHRRGIPVLCCAGAGAKADPTRLRVLDVAESVADPLARAVRHRCAAGPGAKGRCKGQGRGRQVLEHSLYALLLLAVQQRACSTSASPCSAAHQPRSVPPARPPTLTACPPAGCVGSMALRPGCQSFCPPSAPAADWCMAGRRGPARWTTRWGGRMGPWAALGCPGLLCGLH